MRYNLHIFFRINQSEIFIKDVLTFNEYMNEFSTPVLLITYEKYGHMQTISYPVNEIKCYLVFHKDVRK